MLRVSGQSSVDTLTALLNSSVSGTVQSSDPAFAAIRSFQSGFQQIERTPEIVRLMLQCEFNFDGVVNAGAAASREERASLLARDWYDCSFVVVDYGGVEPWLRKCIDEAERGHTVVALIPGRTHTNWFHEHVLERASEVRFIKGPMAHAGHARGAPQGDALAIYRRFIKKRPRQPAAKAVAVLRCRTSFTSDRKRFQAELDEEEGE
jgi:hypothetical protein